LKLLTYILTFFVILIALALGSENHQLVNVNLLFVVVQLPLATLLYITFLSGGLLAFLWLLLKKLSFRSNA